MRLGFVFLSSNVVSLSVTIFNFFLIFSRRLVFSCVYTVPFFLFRSRFEFRLFAAQLIFLRVSNNFSKLFPIGFLGLNLWTYGSSVLMYVVAQSWISHFFPPQLFITFYNIFSTIFFLNFVIFFFQTQKEIRNSLSIFSQFSSQNFFLRSAYQI